MKFVSAFYSCYDCDKPENVIIGVYDTYENALEGLIAYLCDDNNRVGFYSMSELKRDGCWEDHKESYLDVLPNFNLLDYIEDKISFKEWAVSNIKNMTDFDTFCDCFGDSYYKDHPGWSVEIKKFD